MRPSSSVSPEPMSSSPRQSSTRTPAAGAPRSVSRTWVETVIYVSIIKGESRSLDAVFARDLLLVRVGETAVAHDVLAADEQPVDAMRAREDEAPDEVVGAAELEAVRAPDREIGALAGLERADVGAAKHRRAAPCGQAKRLAGAHRPAAAATAAETPGDEECLLDLEEKVAPLVRRGAVDTEADP